MKRSLEVVFAGTPDFSVPALSALYGWCVAQGHHLAGVLTQPDRPAGRGRRMRQSPVRQWADQHGIPVAQPLTLRAAHNRTELESWQPDLLVVVAYGLLLPLEVLTLPKYGCINVHASVLPRWRGAAPIQRAILAGDQTTGVSIMQMDEGLDTGPVWATDTLLIDADETGGSLHDKLAALGARALVETLPVILAGDRQPQAQNEKGATYAAKLTKDEARIDWRDSAADIQRMIRAFDPWPVAHTSVDDRHIRIFSAAQVADPVAAPAQSPGTIIGITGGLYVATGKGVLEIQSLQAAGGRRMDARDFLNANNLLGKRLN